MTCKSEDDFWNTSISSSFSFDDDEELEPPENVFSSISKESNIIPIESLVSKDSMNILLDNDKSTPNTAPPVEETVRDMFNGRGAVVLYVYHTLDEKLKLLDAAVESGDGDIIVAVTLFLKRTLKANIFYQQLAKRKIPITHYANYLILKNSLQELADLYMATGNISRMKDIYYILSKDTSSQLNLCKRLEHLIIDHFQHSSHEEKYELNNNMEFIKWQVENRQNSESVIEQLAIICKNDKSGRNSEQIIIDFKKQFKIDDFQFEWTIMNTLADLKLWEKLLTTFIRPNRLTKKPSLKSAMRPELFVVGLSRHKPPKDVLEQFLQYVGDSETSLHLAQKLDVHKAVIKHYIAQRDRVALLNYKEKVPRQSEEYLLIENAIHMSDKKWKN